MMSDAQENRRERFNENKNAQLDAEAAPLHERIKVHEHAIAANEGDAAERRRLIADLQEQIGRIYGPWEELLTK
jgi:hypothetical protein